MEKKNLTMLATRLGTNEADAFQEICKLRGTTVSRALSDHIRQTIAEERGGNPIEVKHGAQMAVLNLKNADRLKHEVAFHNPHHLDPNKMLNAILTDYFRFLDVVRA